MLKQLPVLQQNTKSSLLPHILFLVAAAVALALQSASGLQRLLIGVVVFVSLVSAAGEWFFLSSLRDFKVEFRQAFFWICLGFFIFAVMFLHYAVIALFGLDKYTWLQYGGITPLVSSSLICVYIGFRKFAQLFDIASKLTSLKIMGLAALVGSLVIVSVPHVHVSVPLYFKFAMVNMVLTLVALAGSAGLARKITAIISPTYHKPMAWLRWYLTIMLFAALIPGVIVFFFIGEFKGTALNIQNAEGGIICQILFLYVGYLFKKSTSR